MYLDVKNTYIYIHKPNLVSYKNMQKIIASNKKWCSKVRFVKRKYSLPLVWY